ncbi:hypothetical protein BN8_03671 [Fibrisoma limi BUZ 3]|uniref:Uncharacterized protein n=2 Tax=Fibrisoma limi TaxID=663275 RepID=I2GKR9_9BACT|nr:hypothetical protein BN8_03671 [Fibrisoma limi BUZ 3]
MALPGFAQKKAPQRLARRDPATGQIQYYLLASVPQNTYTVPTGKKQFERDASAGGFNLIVEDNGIVIPAGTVPPLVKPQPPTGTNGLLSAQFTYNVANKQLSIEGAPAPGQTLQLKFEPLSGTLTGIQSNQGQALNAGDYYPAGTLTGQGEYTQEWSLFNMPQVAIRITWRRVSDGATHSYVFGPVQATRQLLFTRSSGSDPPPTLTYNYQRGYFLGNSFFSHGASTAINWYQNNGMAASGPDKDAPARIAAHLRANGSPSFDYRASGYGSILEQQYANPSSINYAGITAEVTEKFGSQKVDFIAVRVGENIPPGYNQTAFNQTFDQAIAAIPKTDNCKIVVSDGVWLGHDEGHAMLQSWANARSYPFASEASIRETLVNGNRFSPYYAYQYTDPGVQRHFNDEGHQQIANLIIAKIPSGSNGGNNGGGNPTTPVSDAEFDQFAQMADTPWDEYDNRLFGNGAAGTNGRHPKVAIGEKDVLDNGTVRFEVWKLFGGAVAHMSLGSSRDNMLNLYDLGRGAYMSLYGHPQPLFPYKGNTWKNGGWTGMSHNPIQGGDSFDYPCTMLKHVKANGKIYTKVILQQWAFHNQPTDVVLEQITSLASNNAVEVKIRWTQNRTDEYANISEPTAQQQEYPCFMVNGDDCRVAYALGGEPFNANNDVRVLRPIENLNVGWEQTPMYISEPWQAVEYKPGQWGGLVAPGFYRATQSAYLRPSDGGKNEFSDPIVYTADVRSLHLDKNGSQKHTYYLVAGNNYDVVRNFAASLPRETKPDWTFNTAKGRNGWWYKQCEDEREPFPSDGWKITTARGLQSDQTNAAVSKLFSPAIGYKTSDFNTVYIRYKYSGPSSQLRLSWIRNGEKEGPLDPQKPLQEANRWPRGWRGGGSTRLFSVINDGQWHTATINLSGGDWSGVVQEFQLEGFSGTPQSPDQFTMMYFGANNPGN